VTKRFVFDMAHALYGHDGPCKNIHGHTYHLYITVLGKPIEKRGAKNGMVIDFTDLKKLVTKNVIDKYDHALVLNRNSPHKKLAGLRKQFPKLLLVPFQPTCENLLLDIKNTISDKLPRQTTLWKVRLDETPTSSAEWFFTDNS
jgi:6-pyruvoyltetrahydropterin/6-carboxytetrahydropterin synthase